MWCNTEAATPPQPSTSTTPPPPQPLHKRGQHGGGRPLRKGLTLIFCIFIACLVLAHGPCNRP